jgi:uncharacterized protein (DUF1919 family)
MVANDCWGAEVYKDFGLPFESPFIGLFVPGPCFIKLASDFRRVVTSPLRFTNESRYERNPDIAKKGYPIGLLDDDVEIHFLHYDSEAEAKSKWDRRVSRIAYDRLFFKISADGNFPFSDEELRTFDALPLARKLILTSRSLPDVSCAITTPDFLTDGKLMYERTHKYIDMAEWLNSP